MKKTIYILTILIYNLSLGQAKDSNEKLLNWGDYYLINQNYYKAIELYTKYDKTLPFKNQLNLAKAFINIGDLKKAEESFKIIVDSNKAEVMDYYVYADLLKSNPSLATEYREKAYKIPLTFNSLNKETSNDNKAPDENYKIINLNINSEKSDFGAIFLNPSDPEIIIFSSPQKIDFNKVMRKKLKSNSPVYNIFEAKLDKSSLIISNISPLTGSINSIFQDGPASLDVKRNIFYITRSSKTFGKNNLIQLDLFSIPFENSKGKIAIPLSINGQNYSTMHPSISPDGNRLYFSSDRPGGFGGMDLYFVDILEENKLGKPVNLGPDINSSFDEVFPFSFSENILFYSSNNNEGTERLNIKMGKHLIEKRWETFNLKSPFNSNQDDFSFSLDKNLKFGLFTSKREGGKGDDDLYAFKFTPKIIGEDDNYIYSPTDTLAVSFNGILKNDLEIMKNKDPLTILFSKKAHLIQTVKHGELILNDNGSFLYKNIDSSKENDSFSYVINTDYGISDTLNVNLIRKDLPIESFASIYYDFDKSDILTKYKENIDKVISALNYSPEMKVEVNSYTDCRGSKEYNLNLSNRRSKTIIEYIRKEIKNPERVYGKGYGETNILVEDIFDTGIGSSISQSTGGRSKIKNQTRDYIVVSGLYKSEKNAKSKMQKLEKMGYNPLIEQVNGLFKIIVKDFDKFKNAKELIKSLKDSKIVAWILNCNCCNLSEENQQLNRRTDFKIMK